MAEAPPVAQALFPRTQARGKLLRCDSDVVGVAITRRGRRLVTLRPVARGTRLFSIMGRETQVPTRYSLQVGAALHLDQDCARDELDLVNRYFWRYMDHSCDPTTVIRDRKVIALREISEGEGVTFDYNTTEYDMAEPFRCYCGSVLCVGLVRGARYLTPAQRSRLARRLPAYLR